MVRKQYSFTAAIIAVVIGFSAAGCKWQMPWDSSDEAAPPPSAAPEPVKPQSRTKVAENKRVATINQEAISTADLETAIQELQQLSKAYNQEWKQLSAEEDPTGLDLRDILNNLIVLELKAQDALARGLDRRLEVQQRWAYLQRNFLAQEWDRLQRDTVIPTDKAISEFYEQYKLGFLDPERISVLQIVTPTLAEAEAVRARAVQGAVFKQLAVEVSIGESKEQGGEAGWFLREIDRNRLAAMGLNPTEQVLFPQLEPVAFALEKDQISQPVKGPDGNYYVLQLADRKPARQRTEVEVHDDIKASLMIQEVQKQIEQLRKKAEIKEFSERLGSVEQ